MRIRPHGRVRHRGRDRGREPSRPQAQLQKAFAASAGAPSEAISVTRAGPRSMPVNWRDLAVDPSITTWMMWPGSPRCQTCSTALRQRSNQKTCVEQAGPCAMLYSNIMLVGQGTECAQHAAGHRRRPGVGGTSARGSRSFRCSCSSWPRQGISILRISPFLAAKAAPRRSQEQAARAGPVCLVAVSPARLRMMIAPSASAYKSPVRRRCRHRRRLSPRTIT